MVEILCQLNYIYWSLLLLSIASPSSANAATSCDSSSFADSFYSDPSLLAAGIDTSSRPSSTVTNDSNLLDRKKSTSSFSLSRFSNAFRRDPKSVGSRSETVRVRIQELEHVGKGGGSQVLEEDETSPLMHTLS